MLCLNLHPFFSGAYRSRLAYSCMGIGASGGYFLVHALIFYKSNLTTIYPLQPNQTCWHASHPQFFFSDDPNPVRTRIQSVTSLVKSPATR